MGPLDEAEGSRRAKLADGAIEDEEEEEVDGDHRRRRGLAELAEARRKEEWDAADSDEEARKVANLGQEGR